MEEKSDMMLLARHYLAHECTDEELSGLLSWLEESEAHRKSFSEALALCSASMVLEDPVLEQRQQKMLARLNARIDSCRNQERKHRYLSRFAQITAAAAVVVGVILGHEHFSKKQETLPAAALTHAFTYFNPSSEIAEVRLEDGTSVLLGGGSRLDYSLAHKNGKSVREARISGKAYFDVAHDSLCPFIVDAQDLLVKVVGTRFIVEASPDSDRLQVLLEQGIVRLQDPDGEDLAGLAENQMAVFDRKAATLELDSLEVGAYVLDNFKRITFSDIGVVGLQRKIEDIYGVVLETEDSLEDMTRYKINISRSNTLAEVLDIVKALTGVSFEVRK